MTIRHIIFDARVLAKFPQTDSFFRTARNSTNGPVAFFRSHCAPRTDILYVLDLLRHKGIEIIVLSPTPALAGQVLNALGITCGRSIGSLDEIEGEKSEYGYVTLLSKGQESAKALGFKAVRFVPGTGEGCREILSLAGLRKIAN